MRRSRKSFNLQVCVCVCVCARPCTCLVVQSCPTLWPYDRSPHVLLHPRGFSRQEYRSGVATPSSRGSSQPRDWTQVFCIAGGFFTVWATREGPIYKYFWTNLRFLPSVSKDNWLQAKQYLERGRFWGINPRIHECMYSLEDTWLNSSSKILFIALLFVSLILFNTLINFFELKKYRSLHLFLYVTLFHSIEIFLNQRWANSVKGLLHKRRPGCVHRGEVCVSLRRRDGAILPLPSQKVHLELFSYLVLGVLFKNPLRTLCMNFLVLCLYQYL